MGRTLATVLWAACALFLQTASATNPKCPFCGCQYEWWNDINQTNLEIDHTLSGNQTNSDCNKYCKENFPTYVGKKTDIECWWDTRSNKCTNQAKCSPAKGAKSCSDIPTQFKCEFGSMQCDVKLLKGLVSEKCTDCYDCTCDYYGHYTEHHKVKSPTIATPASCLQACRNNAPLNVTVYHVGCIDGCRQNAKHERCPHGCTEVGQPLACYMNLERGCQGGLECACDLKGGKPDPGKCALRP